MREYIYSVMKDERRGFAAALLRGALSFISFFYGFFAAFAKIISQKSAKSLPCMVISVGNLTLGGTGKTPAACMLAVFLRREGHRPCVLIRGYGNDEWKMLKSKLGDIPVIVGRDRVASGKKALSEFKSDTLILDDGFQHWRLRRNLDIVLVDASDPFGNRRLFPRGVLREDIKDIRRADVIMLTKTDMAKGLEGVKGELGRTAPGIPILESVHSPLRFYDIGTKEEKALSFINGRKACVLSSIVNTGYFEFLLGRLGADIMLKFHYPDHYDYRASDVDYVINECRRLNIDTIATTEKDAAKLRDLRIPNPEPRTPNDERQTAGPRILVLQVELKVTHGEDILRERVLNIYGV